MERNKSNWQCHKCNCVFDIVFNELNNNDLYDVKCMFCNANLGKTSLSYNYKQKPLKHNANWTLVDEILLLKSIINNKNYEYICNILERTHDSIHGKRTNLSSFIKKSFNNFNDFQNKFLFQLELYDDCNKIIEFFNPNDTKQYKKFTLKEQKELEKFIEIITNIRSEYFKFKLKNKKSIKWLNYLTKTNKINIKHEQNGGEYNIPNTLYKADGYCEETNTIYEFHGCMYHGCIMCFDKNNINPIKKIENKLLYENTLKREENLKKLGYNLISIWEHEFTLK